MGAKAVVMASAEAKEQIGPQGQALTPLITNASSGTTGLSGGLVRMPPGGVSRTHCHAESEIIVAVLFGNAATVVWEDGKARPLPHGPAEMCYVPAGVPHCAVNISESEPVIALEFRTDPEFNTDVVLLPELEDQVAAIVAELRKEAHASSRSVTSKRAALDWLTAVPEQPVA